MRTDDAIVNDSTCFPITVEKHPRAQELARENRLPYTYLMDSGRKAGGDAWLPEDAAFKAPIEASYEAEGLPFYACARLWDDGVIAPGNIRTCLAPTAAARLPEPTRFGLFQT